jgi:hypothetical protein
MLKAKELGIDHGAREEEVLDIWTVVDTIGLNSLLI